MTPNYYIIKQSLFLIFNEYSYVCQAVLFLRQQYAAEAFSFSGIHLAVRPLSLR